MCVCVCVCVYESIHVAVGLWGSLCSLPVVCVCVCVCVSVCVCVCDVWQCARVAGCRRVCTFGDVTGVRVCVFMAVVQSVCEESVLLCVCVCWM